MAPNIITADRDLRDFCAALANEPTIALDTEFVSEDTYRSHLCLIQVAAGDRLVAIDPLAVGDLVPFWEALAEPGHETIVHAGREEVGFVVEAIGRPPAGLVDVQIAAGLVGWEYPAGYSTLIQRVLGQTLTKRETRTDWRRRPLSDRQIEYALDDVRHLSALRDALGERLARLERAAWLEEEMRAWLEDVSAVRSRERWRKVTGSAGLSRRDLAVVREIWLWREAEAERRNWPSRRVLRDDLIVELARRGAADEKQIRAVRGLDRGDLKRTLAGLSQAIERGLVLTDEQCPRTIRRETSAQLSMVGQLLSTALASICRSAEVAASLVGTAQDVRDLVAYRLRRTAETAGEVPLLARGWRAEVVGHLLEDLLLGKVALYVRDPDSADPLGFEPRPH